MRDGDTGADERAYSEWKENLGSTGPGVRSYLYTTNMNVNSVTYNTIDNAVTHRVGSVWCTMLWELTWGLIDVYGFDTDFCYGKKGNNIALMLVTEALKLQSCNPDFAEARDAILMADMAIYGGANQCIIWQAFAKRGLGEDARSGYHPLGRYESFDIPANCSGNCPINIHQTGNIVGGTYQSGKTIVSTGTIGYNQNVDYDAANFVCLFPNFLADSNNGTVFVTVFHKMLLTKYILKIIPTHFLEKL